MIARSAGALLQVQEGIVMVPGLHELSKTEASPGRGTHVFAICLL